MQRIVLLLVLFSSVTLITGCASRLDSSYYIQMNENALLGENNTAFIQNWRFKGSPIRASLKKINGQTVPYYFELALLPGYYDITFQCTDKSGTYMYDKRVNLSENRCHEFNHPPMSSYKKVSTPKCANNFSGAMAGLDDKCRMQGYKYIPYQIQEFNCELVEMKTNRCPSSLRGKAPMNITDFSKNTANIVTPFRTISRSEKKGSREKKK